MSAKAVREFDGKNIISHWLLKAPVVGDLTLDPNFIAPSVRIAQVKLDDDYTAETLPARVQEALDRAERLNPWLLTEKLVAKPDQLIKRRGKSGLLLLNATWDKVKEWITSHAGKEIAVSDIFIN
jgi:ATP citrate (pro-S)-lyase